MPARLLHPRVYGGAAPAPAAGDFPQRGEAYVLGLNSTDYWLGWTEAIGTVVEYEVSLDDGGSWTPTGSQDPWLHVTGRTPAATDETKVRAVFIGGSSVRTLDLDVVLPGIGSRLCIVSVIGTDPNPFNGGGACDYATFGDWELDLVALAGGTSLAAANVLLQAWGLRQEFVNTPFTIQGATTSATCYREATAGPGQSFRDRADRDTAPHRYTGSRGCALRDGSVTDAPTIDLVEDYAHVSRLQIASTGNGTSTHGGWGIHSSRSGAPVYVDRCIIQSGTLRFVLSLNHFSHVVSNCTIVNVRPSGVGQIENIVESNGGVDTINCIQISLGQVAPVASVARQPGSTFTKSCAFGVQYLHDVEYGTGDGTVTTPVGTGEPGYVDFFTNTDEAIDISGAVVGLPSGVTQVDPADCFESLTNGMGNYDLRPKAGSPLLAAGVTGAY